MFWDTDAMKAAATVAEKFLGPVGRYVVGNPKFYDVRLYTHTAGLFWYGDIDWPTERKQVVSIAASLQEPVYVVPPLDDAESEPYHSIAMATVLP